MSPRLFYISSLIYVECKTKSRKHFRSVLLFRKPELIIEKPAFCSNVGIFFAACLSLANLVPSSGHPMQNIQRVLLAQSVVSYISDK